MNKSTLTLHTPSNASIDTAIQKFGLGSLKLSGACPVKFPGYNLTTNEVGIVSYRMPAYDSKMSNEDLWHVVSYVLSLIHI